MNTPLNLVSTGTGCGIPRTLAITAPMNRIAASSFCPLARTPLLHMPSIAEYNGFVYCSCEDSSTTLALLFPLVCLPAVTERKFRLRLFDVEDLRITLRFSSPRLRFGEKFPKKCKNSSRMYPVPTYGIPRQQHWC